MVLKFLHHHQVVRSRLQEQGHARNSAPEYTGVFDCIKKVMQKEGLRGFYRGCATNLLRTTPSAVITFTSYEVIHRFLNGVVPQAKHSGDNAKSDEPKQGNGGNGEVSFDSGLRQTQTQSKTRVPLGNKEKLTTRH